MIDGRTAPSLLLFILCSSLYIPSDFLFVKGPKANIVAQDASSSSVFRWTPDDVHPWPLQEGNAPARPVPLEGYKGSGGFGSIVLEKTSLIVKERSSSIANT
jgi:hypothetical protein